MLQKDITLKVAAETIAGIVIHTDTNRLPPNFIFLHGAGTGTKENVLAITPPVITCGMNILSVDFSGHGKSTGTLKEGSLIKRIHESRTAIDQFAAQSSLTICGLSMGGYIAIKMLQFYPIDSLILMCPALYDQAATNVRFDAGFTEIIRAPMSWRKTDVLPLLQSYTGKLLIIMGEKDTVIPADVIELIIKHTPNASKKELYIIPNCPHRIPAWLVDQETELVRLHQKVQQYL